MGRPPPHQIPSLESSSAANSLARRRRLGERGSGGGARGRRLSVESADLRIAATLRTKSPNGRPNVVPQGEHSRPRGNGLRAESSAARWIDDTADPIALVGSTGRPWQVGWVSRELD